MRVILVPVVDLIAAPILLRGLALESDGRLVYKVSEKELTFAVVLLDESAQV